MNAADLELSTPRLRLVPLTMRDLEAVWPSVSDPAISERMSWEPHQTKDETRAFIERIEKDRADGKGVTWSMRCEDGFCGIFSIIAILRSHRALRYDRGELAYWCARAFEGKGFMQEAGRRVIEFAFNKADLNRLVVAHHVDNDRSRKLIERLGFKPIGIEHEAFMKHGRWIDTKIYELLKRDFIDT